MAVVSVSPSQPLDTSVTKAAVFAIDPVKVGGVGTSYDLAVVSGGAILVTSATAYVGTSVTGLTTLAVSTNNTIPVVLLTATAAASLTGDLNLTPFTTRLYLASGKKIQYTVIGTGTAGTMFLAVEYRPLTVGAVIA